jgi:hypothetical protein
LNFEEFWQAAIEYLQSQIAASDRGELVVDNWRPDIGATGERFPVTEAGDETIKCLTIYASKEIKLPREDMASLYEMWDDYLSGEATRMDLIEKIPRPTYCVAVMKLLKDNIS